MAIVNDLIPKSILSPSVERPVIEPKLVREGAALLGGALVMRALVEGTKEALHAKPIEGSKEYWRSRHGEQLLASAKPNLKSGSEG